MYITVQLQEEKGAQGEEDSQHGESEEAEDEDYLSDADHVIRGGDVIEIVRIEN